MKVNNRLIAILTIALFAGNILTILPLANATVGGALHIAEPDMVAAGGPVWVDTTGMTATGGTIYFYLSLDDDPLINSGDIYFASVKTVDAIATQTLFLGASVPAEEYYIKGADIKSVGRDAVVSDNTIEVISEGIPSVVLNDLTGNVGDNPEIEITDADDYDDVAFFWKTFLDDPDLGTLTDGELTADIFEVPNSYKGAQKILVWLDGDDGSYATYVQFTVTPHVEWDFTANPGGLSILAEELDQEFTITGTGFAEGTVAENSITLTLKNFMTGAAIDVYEARHDETDVGEDALEGTLDMAVLVDAVEAGILDVKIPVDSSSETFTAAFYSSAPIEEGDFTSITHYKISATSGMNDDDVTFSFINLGDTADVTIRWIGETVTKDVAVGNADLNGAYKADYTLDELPGGQYTVRAVVTVGATTRERTIATFTVNPDFWVDQDDANVGDTIDLYGTGFPTDSTLDTVKIGGADGIDVTINVLATGEFWQQVEVPEVSGGGKDVTVKIEGENADGVAISAQTTIVIDPMVYYMEAIEFFDGESIWEEIGVGTLIFPGHIVYVEGNGYLAGETLTVTMYDGDDKVVGTATIGDGEKVDADGNVELVAWLPNAKTLYPAGKPACYLKIAGPTSTNKDNSYAFDVSASDDAQAFILTGIGNDGDADIDVKVGETLRVVGFGFRTKTIDLTFEESGDDIKTVNSVNGFFDTTFTVPAMVGNVDGEHYHVNALDAWSCFYVYPNIVLTPTIGYVDSKFTVTGTGFADGWDVDISWVGIVGDEVLDTVDADDVEDGSFSIEVTVPTVVPQSYKVEAVVDDEVWKSAAFTVGDKSAVSMNQTLTEILAQLKSTDFAALKTKVDAAQASAAAAQTTATAAQTSAAAAQTAANAAKTAADAAKASADAAGTKADAATTAANAAATAAKSASDAANGMTTLIYAAIGASLIAALAAIVALMQISRKIA